MQTINLTQAADASGTLRFAVPGHDPNRQYRVVLLVEPASPGDGPLGRDERGWPAGFFERLPGSWQGEFAEDYEGDWERRAEL
jgi:hypothetical protein